MENIKTAAGTAISKMTPKTESMQSSTQSTSCQAGGCRDDVLKLLATIAAKQVIHGRMKSGMETQAIKLLASDLERYNQDYVLEAINIYRESEKWFPDYSDLMPHIKARQDRAAKMQTELFERQATHHQMIADASSLNQKWGIAEDAYKRGIFSRDDMKDIHNELQKAKQIESKT